MSVNLEERLVELRNILAECDQDAAKAQSGNKSAGVRFRKALQAVINTSKEVRKEVLDATAKD